MSDTPGAHFSIGKDARDLLYKDYVHGPPIRFDSKGFSWISDLSCKVNLIAPGLNALFSYNVPDYGRVEVQYENSFAEIAGGIGVKRSPLKTYDPIANFSAVIGGSCVCSIGTDLTFDISAGTFKKLSAGFSLNTDLFSAALSMDRLDTLKASCFTMVNPLSNTALGAELKHRFSSNDTAVAFGAQHAVFPSTLAKTRVSTQGDVSVLIRQGFWQTVFLSMSGEMDFTGVKRSPKFGLSLSLRL